MRAISSKVRFAGFESGPRLLAARLPLSALAGRVVLIDFWATWCAPCIRELPNLLELYARHSEEGFAIVGLSLDEDRRAVEGALRHYDLRGTDLRAAIEALL